MKASKLVEHLQQAVEKLGYKIRIEQGRFKGGNCIHDEAKLVIMNRRLGDEERAEILARTLAENDYEQIFLMPEVRAYVEKYIPVPAEAEEPSDEAQPS